jgi:hypothetical protein
VGERKERKGIPVKAWTRRRSRPPCPHSPLPAFPPPSVRTSCQSSGSIKPSFNRSSPRRLPSRPSFPHFPPPHPSPSSLLQPASS